MVYRVAHGARSKGDPKEVTADRAEAIVQVNALSHALLTAEVMPLLLRSKTVRAAIADTAKLLTHELFRFPSKPPSNVEGDAAERLFCVGMILLCV